MLRTMAALQESTLNTYMFSKYSVSLLFQYKAMCFTGPDPQLLVLNRFEHVAASIYILWLCKLSYLFQE